MSCFLLAIVAAACAVGQSFTAGILLEGNDGTRTSWLAPAATYGPKGWTTFNPKSIRGDWRLRGSKFDGSVVHVVRPCDGEGCWVTDLPKHEGKQIYQNAVGVLTTADVPVIMFQDQTGNASEQDKVKAFLGKTIEMHLGLILASKHLHPTKVVVSQRAEITRSETAIDGQTYYHVFYQSEIYDSQAPAGSDCKNFVFRLQAWFTESAAGIRNLVTAQPQFDYCDGTNVTDLEPVGAILLDGTAFVIAAEGYYEGASAVVLIISPKSVKRLAENRYADT